MVKIRLQRVGAKHQPYYRIVVVDSRVKRDGKVLETIGHYNPIPNPPAFDIDKDRLAHWRGVGAQTSEAVMVLLGETEPKKHQPKNVKEEATPPTPSAEPQSEEAAISAPETTPEASPELAEAVAASEEASPEATPEEVAQTVETSTGVTGETQAEEDQPTSQEEPVALAETAEETDDTTATEKEEA